MKTHTAKAAVSHTAGTVTWTFTGRTFCGKNAGQDVMTVAAGEKADCLMCRRNEQAGIYNGFAPASFDFETGRWMVGSQVAA